MIYIGKDNCAGGDCDGGRMQENRCLGFRPRGTMSTGGTVPEVVCSSVLLLGNDVQYLRH